MGPLALTPSSLHSDLVHKRDVLSVFFSPDGKLLATGAQDGVVRVSFGTLMLAIAIAVIIILEADAQHRTTSGALDLGHCQEANLQPFQGTHWADPIARFLVGREIDRLWVGRSYGEDLGYDRRIVKVPCNDRQQWQCGKHGYQF